PRRRAANARARPMVGLSPSQSGNCPYRSGLRYVVGLCCLAAALAGAGCEFPPAPVAPDRPRGGGEGPGHRPQELALTPEQELALGRRAYREVLHDPEHFGAPLPIDHPESR